MTTGFGESTKWANRVGVPVPEVPKKSGEGTKKPNINDAIQLGLLPRVTSVIKLVSAPSLNDWRVDNAITLCHASPPSNEDKDKYLERIQGKIEDDLEESSSRGKKIHADLHHWVSGVYPEDPVSRHLCDELVKWGEKNGVICFRSENNFANLEKGFAGTDDLEAILEDGSIIILDLKTRKDALKNSKPYEKDLWQMCAYSIGRNIDEPKRLVLVVVDQFRPEVPVAFYAYEKKEIERGRKEFMLILELWKSLNEYRPEEWKP